METRLLLLYLSQIMKDHLIANTERTLEEFFAYLLSYRALSGWKYLMLSPLLCAVCGLPLFGAFE